MIIVTVKGREYEVVEKGATEVYALKGKERGKQIMTGGKAWWAAVNAYRAGDFIAFFPGITY